MNTGVAKAELGIKRPLVGTEINNRDNIYIIVAIIRNKETPIGDEMLIIKKIYCNDIKYRN